MKDCYVLGIDPGLNGGIAWMGGRGGGLVVLPMPTRPGPKSGRVIDAPELCRLLSRHDSAENIRWDLAAVEVVHSRPTGCAFCPHCRKNKRRQGAASIFTFGRGYGAVLAVLEIIGIPIQHVQPQRWKKTVLDGLGTDKSAAVRWCQSRFPKTRFLATARSTKPHDGMCDATCLAEFARLTVLGKGK